MRDNVRAVQIDVGEVRLAVAGQRCRYADEQDIGFGDAGEIGGRLEATATAQRGNLLIADATNVGATRVQRRDFLRIDVESERGKPASTTARTSGRPT